MSKTIQSLGKDMVVVGQNPQAMARIMLNSLSDRGIEIASPVDPIVYSAECSLMSGHAAIVAADNVLPKVYSSMATSWEDLYRHMSDKDAVDLFYQPTRNQFIWTYDLEELRDAAVEIDDIGTKKIIIPVDTIYQAKDRRYAQPYPIEIRFLSNDWIQVRWDTSVPNPVTNIPANEIEWQKRPYTKDNVQRTLLAINVPVEQYEIRHQTDQVLPRLGWNKSYTIDDNYFTTRMWYRKDNQWSEMKIHHSIDVIDPLDPTAVVTVAGKRVSITIPEVYINSGLVSGDVRMSIYSTRGAEVVNLANYPVSDFSWVYKDHLSVSGSEFYNALKKVETISLLSVGTSTGGRDGLTFLEARERVIANTLGDRQNPITDAQLIDNLSDQGYDVYKAIDVITSRIYLAAITMPKPGSSTISGAIGTVNDPVTLTISDLDDHEAVLKNGNRWTITDDCLFKQFSGNVAIYKDATLSKLKFLRPVDRIDYLRDLQLLNLPFHVVLDINNDIVDGRAYAIKKPQLLSRVHKMSNDKLSLEVSTQLVEIVKKGTNYEITTITRSDDNYKAIPVSQRSAYLSFDNDGDKVFVAGTRLGEYEGGEDRWMFRIETNLDIDRNNKLIVENFSESNGQTYPMACPLTVDFNVVYSLTGNYNNTDLTDIDQYIPGWGEGIGASLDLLTLEFGKPLTNMWVNARAMPGTIKYKTYEEDVPKVYLKDEIETDEASGGHKYNIVDGKVEFVYAHRKGDPILKDGVPELRFKKGEQVFENGQAVVEVDRSMDLESNLWLVDARYLVTDDATMSEYNDYWYGYVIENAMNVLPSLAKSALEQTEIHLTAKNTVSRIKVKLGNEAVNYIPAEQKFGIDYYVTDTVRQNQELLKQIKSTTNTVIENYLTTAAIVSTTDITKLLKESLGDNIKGVEMRGFENAQETRIFTILDENARATIAKRLIMSAEGKVELENDISISYNRYR